MTRKIECSMTHCKLYRRDGCGRDCYFNTIEVKNNYDRLHSMNETQLATWLAAMLGVQPFDGTGNDYRKWLDWLRQEAADA